MPLTVQIVNRLAPGGIETLALELMGRARGDMMVFSLDGSREELVGGWPRLASLGDRVIGFERQPGFRPGLIRTIAAKLKELKPDGLILHHIGPLLYGGLAGRISTRPRLLHMEHDAWHYAERSHRAILKALSYGLDVRHVAVSDTVAAEMSRIGTRETPVVVPPGVDMALFSQTSREEARKRLGIGSNEAVVGTAGRLVGVKRQRDLLSALTHLPDTTRCVIAGDGPLRGDLEAHARDLGIAGRVDFLGHVDAIKDILPAFDVFCLPSEAEGLPRSLLEAQASGVPVVATDVGGVSRAVCPRTGELTGVGDPPALARSIAKLLNEPPSGEVCRQFVAERFSLDATLIALGEGLYGEGSRL